MTEQESLAVSESLAVRDAEADERDRRWALNGLPLTDEIERIEDEERAERYADLKADVLRCGAPHELFEDGRFHENEGGL